MYRIRRETGDEVNFGSIDELGAAVAAGVVTAKAEIFHARAEKWLPIASHPHFKMAHDRINSASAPKSSTQRPALSASGQRPAITTPQAAQPAAPSAPAPPIQAPQLRVMRPDAAPPAASASTDAPAMQKPAPRWNSAQRPAARAVAPRPSTPSTPSASDLRLVRPDIRLNGAATAPALPEVEFELVPTLEAPAVPEPVAPPPAAVEPTVVEEPVVQRAVVELEVTEPAPAEPVAVEPVAFEPVAEVAAPEPVTETVVERSPASVELVSHEQQPRGEVEIINPDRTMPVVNDREIPALEIPAPIRDFAPIETPAEPAARSSKAALIIGLGVAAAIAAGIGFFAFKPSSAAPTAAVTKAPTPVSSAPVASSSEPSSTPSTTPVAAPKPPTGASTGLGGDVQPRKPKRSSEDAKATVGDGLEPPPEDVIPAAPSVGKLSDAAALPTVDGGASSLKMLDRQNALERQRRLIDSSMKP